MITKHKIAIVLINFNNNQDTIECVQSVFKSEGIDLPFIVVVDNNSKTKNIGDHLTFYPKLKVIYNTENAGFGRANNIGIDWIKSNLDTEFIFILNNDTIVRTDTIINLLNSFPADPKIAMVAPKILTYGSDPRIWYGGGYFSLSKMSINIDKIGSHDRELGNRTVDFASGCAMLFRTSFLEENECFDHNIFMYDEDVELCIRMKRNNQQILFVNNSILYHKCQGSQSQEINEKAKLNQLHPNHPGVRFYLSNTIPNRYYILNKHFTGTEKSKIKAKLTLYWVMKSFQYFIKGNIKLSLFTTSKAFSAWNGQPHLN